MTKHWNKFVFWAYVEITNATMWKYYWRGFIWIVTTQNLKFNSLILWVLTIRGQGIKSERADIFHQSRFLWLLRHTDVPQKGRNSCLWLQSRPVLSSFAVVLMSCRVDFHVVRSALQYSACRIWFVYIIIFADQVFIDPTFFGIFVCRPLQSFVVNVWATESTIWDNFLT